MYMRSSALTGTVLLALLLPILYMTVLTPRFIVKIQPNVPRMHEFASILSNFYGGAPRTFVVWPPTHGRTTANPAATPLKIVTNSCFIIHIIHRAMLAGLHGQSMLQGTSLIAFQTYHTAEHYRSMNEKLTLYNMRKLPFVYNARCWIDHKA